MRGISVIAVVVLLTGSAPLALACPRASAESGCCCPDPEEHEGAAIERACCCVREEAPAASPPAPAPADVRPDPVVAPGVVLGQSAGEAPRFDVGEALSRAEHPGLSPPTLVALHTLLLS